MHILDELTIAVLDVETTGLSADYGDRICEVGIVRAQGETILDTYQSLVNPQRPISPGAARVNGLSDEEVSLAPCFADIAEAVLERINGAVVVCHNAPFDLSFMAAELRRLGLVWQPEGVIDTLEIARRHSRSGSNSLSAVAARLGIRNPHEHRALGDALTTLQVLRSFYHQMAGTARVQDAAWVDAYRPAPRRMEEAILPPALQEALAMSQAIEITYLDGKGNSTIRTITPRQVLAENGAVYLVAYCHLRQADRRFRLDRIVAIGEIG